jgi:hypothetical protein
MERGVEVDTVFGLKRTKKGKKGKKKKKLEKKTKEPDTEQYSKSKAVASQNKIHAEEREKEKKQAKKKDEKHDGQYTIGGQQRKIPNMQKSKAKNSPAPSRSQSKRKTKPKKEKNIEISCLCSPRRLLHLNIRRTVLAMWRRGHGHVWSGRKNSTSFRIQPHHLHQRSHLLDVLPCCILVKVCVARIHELANCHADCGFRVANPSVFQLRISPDF